MKRLPRIAFKSPEQAREVYDHVRQQKPLKNPVRLAYAALNHFFDPYVSYESDALDDLSQVQQDHNPHIYVYNHQNQDYMSVGAILHEVAPYDVGRIRTLANDQTYSIPYIRPLAKAWGAIPVARRVDYQDDPEAVRKVKLEVAKRTYSELYACCVDLLEADYPLGIYLEGDVNRHEPWLYPSYVDLAKNGAAVIGVRAARPELPTAITPIGHTNGPGNLHKPKRNKVSAHVGRTIFVGPEDDIPDVTYRLRASLQHCVTVASATR